MVLKSSEKDDQGHDNDVIHSRRSIKVEPPTPPDGGWGWVIMFASFIINVLVDGVCFTFGIFYLEFLDYFQESKSYTSWVGSVLNGMYLSMGPIVSVLANRYGCRRVAIAGSIFASAAYILSTFSSNVTVLIITYGAMGGAGFGLMYLPAIVMVGYYFQKRRAFATGMAVCGSGIGAFVFAPLCEFLLSNYDWKGSLWVIAAIVLNGVVMGALFRPLEAKKVEVTEVLETKEETKIRRKSETTNGSKPVNNSVSRLQDKNTNGLQLMSMQNIHQATSETYCDKNFCSMIDIRDSPSGKKLIQSHVREASRPMYRKDIFYSGSLLNMPVITVSRDTENGEASVRHLSECSHASICDIEDTGCSGRCSSITESISEMMDFSLLKNPVFAIYGVSCFLCMAGFFVPFIYLPAHAVESGMSRDQAAFLLSIIGIANTVARVLCGWVSDQSWADCLLINNCALVVGGIATILSPFCTTYATLAIYACVFGMSIAVFVSLRSILMVELIGLDKLTNAFGLVTLCQGLSSFIGAPIAGSLYDLTGDYSLSFYVAGTTLALAGLICFPLRRVARWQKHKKSRHAISNGHKTNIYKALNQTETKK